MQLVFADIKNLSENNTAYNTVFPIMLLLKIPMFFIIVLTAWFL